jgi:hypothetical protein
LLRCTRPGFGLGLALQPSDPASLLLRVIRLVNGESLANRGVLEPSLLPLRAGFPQVSRHERVCGRQLELLPVRGRRANEYVVHKAIARCPGGASASPA